MKPEPKKIHRSKRSVEERLELMAYSISRAKWMNSGSNVILPREALLNTLKNAYLMGKRDTLNKQGN